MLHFLCCMNSIKRHSLGSLGAMINYFYFMEAFALNRMHAFSLFLTLVLELLTSYSKFLILACSLCLLIATESRDASQSKRFSMALLNSIKAIVIVMLPGS